MICECLMANKKIDPIKRNLNYLNKCREEFQVFTEKITTSSISC